MFYIIRTNVLINMTSYYKNELKKLIEQHGFDTFGIVDINPNLDFKKELDEFLEKKSSWRNGMDGEKI